MIKEELSHEFPQRNRHLRNWRGLIIRPLIKRGCSWQIARPLAPVNREAQLWRSTDGQWRVGCIKATVQQYEPQNIINFHDPYVTPTMRRCIAKHTRSLSSASHEFARLRCASRPLRHASTHNCLRLGKRIHIIHTHVLL